MTRKSKVLKIPKITVITPTFNRASLVSGAIRSVLNQSFKSFEYLIIDDGSTDHTGRVIERFLKDPRVFYISQRNGGMASALNTGLRLARGEWIAFLDSDDEYYSHHLKYLYSKTKLTPDLDLIIGAFDVIGAPLKQSFVVDYHKPSKLISLDKIEVVQGTLLIKKMAVRSVGGFHDGLSDIDIVERMRANGCQWAKAKKPSLKYYFGRTNDSLSIQMVRSQGSVKAKISL